LDIMFEAPSLENVERILITKEMVENKQRAIELVKQSA